MKVERIKALPLTKEQALVYARVAVGQCMNKTAKKPAMRAEARSDAPYTLNVPTGKN